MEIDDEEMKVWKEYARDYEYFRNLLTDYEAAVQDGSKDTEMLYKKLNHESKCYRMTNVLFEAVKSKGYAGFKSSLMSMIDAEEKNSKKRNLTDDEEEEPSENLIERFRLLLTRGGVLDGMTAGVCNECGRIFMGGLHNWYKCLDHHEDGKCRIDICCKCANTNSFMILDTKKHISLDLYQTTDQRSAYEIVPTKKGPPESEKKRLLRECLRSIIKDGKILNDETVRVCDECGMKLLQGLHLWHKCTGDDCEVDICESCFKTDLKLITAKDHIFYDFK
jgi:hypothetical protein